MIRRCIVQYVKKCPIHHENDVSLADYCADCGYNKGIKSHYIYCSFGDEIDDV